jgi:hypothetical protein
MVLAAAGPGQSQKIFLCRLAMNRKQWKVHCFQGVRVRARGFVYGYECVFGRKQPDDLKMDFLDESYV